MFLTLLVALSQAPQPAPPVILRDYLVISGLSRAGRTPVRQDTLELQIVRGQFKLPVVGGKLTSPTGQERTWQAAQAKEDGSFEHQALRGGYAFAKVTSETARVAMLEASGHNMVYVNGEPRMGDPYSTGYVHLPVQLKQGENTFLFAVGRGSLKAKLTAPPAKVFFDTGDPTLPDLVLGEEGKKWAAVPVINTGSQTLRGLYVRSIPKRGKVVYTPIPAIGPMSVRKVGFEIAAQPIESMANMDVNLEIVRAKGAKDGASPVAKVTLGIRKVWETHKRTFVSEIDGSVQYYALNPAQSVTNPNYTWSQATVPSPALVLSLHGASVEAIGQASAYSSKSWAHIVCPTNRRPFGFDWEDWGRLDALEVLKIAQRDLETDPTRVYLTGHSMGGHGTWNMGVTFPNEFAAIAPSAGWVSFFSYGGGVRQSVDDPVGAILQRASNPSDTLALTTNLKDRGVYILHGDADDNVPVSEARTMKQKLTDLGFPFGYHEQPKAGHWWENSDEAGAECVDWPEMFDLFAHTRLAGPNEVRDIDFATFDPTTSTSNGWADIVTQIEPLKLSRLQLRLDPTIRRITGVTQNVAFMWVGFGKMPNGTKVSAKIDGQDLQFTTWAGGYASLIRENGKWRRATIEDTPGKNAVVGGLFKRAFDNKFILVYGTVGNAEENAWAKAKARFDAEQFWVRGNGSVPVLSDVEYAAILRYPDRNVILYGNADTNALWNAFLSHAPIKVRRGEIEIGARKLQGTGLSCQFLYPSQTKNMPMVGAVSGTGIEGMRLSDRMSYFTSGSAFPDVLVTSSKMLEQGLPGILAAGFFGNDWSVEKGDIAVRP
jgi:poly(3-hydroxybutyrate) depolymerase